MNISNKKNGKAQAPRMSFSLMYGMHKTLPKYTQVKEKGKKNLVSSCKGREREKEFDKLMHLISLVDEDCELPLVIFQAVINSQFIGKETMP